MTISSIADRFVGVTGAIGFDFEMLKTLVRPELLRLVKQGTHINAADNTADPESEALWAEFDALEGALI